MLKFLHDIETMFLKGPTIQLLPYHSSNWELLARWFYDSKYKDMWRHHPQAWGQTEFENYPRIINGQVFLIVSENKPIGFIQMIPDCKTNRGVFIGTLIEENQRNREQINESFMLLFNYAFNRLGYRKAIVEILNKHAGLKKHLLNEGFLNEGTLFGEAFIDGEYVDECRLSMSAPFFNKKHKQTVELWAVS